MPINNYAAQPQTTAASYKAEALGRKTYVGAGTRRTPARCPTPANKETLSLPYVPQQDILIPLDYHIKPICG